jgi:hypothetical protein
MEAPVKAFVPKEFRSLSTSPIEEKYEENRKRIEDAQKRKDAEKRQDASAEMADTDGSIFLAASLQDTAQSKPGSEPKAKSKIPDFAQFAPNITQFIPDWKQFVPTNVSVFDYDKFIPDYEKYMDVKKYQDFAKAYALQKEHAPSKASECTSMKELDAWRKAVASPMEAFIPKMWRSFTMDSINEEYARNKKRIEAAEEAKKVEGADATADTTIDTLADTKPSRRLSATSSKSIAQPEASDLDKFIPNYAKYQDVQKFMKFAKFMQHTKAPASAADCKTKKELDAWRSVKEAPIKAFVPKKWQQFESIQRRYNESLKRIEKNQADAEQTKTVATAVPMELQVEDGFSRGVKQFTPMRIETPEVQDLVPSYATHSDVHLFLSFATFMQKNDAPEKVEDCKTMNQLNAWHKKQNAIIKEFVPEAYQSFPAHSLEKKYEESKNRIDASEKAAQKTPSASGQLASMASNAPLIALVGVMGSAALAASLSWRLRIESTLQERLLDPEAPLAA